MHVVIIGKGPGWKKAPTEGNLWGVNDLCLRRDVKVVFNLHQDDESAISQQIKSYVNKNKVPLISLTELPDVAISISFPLSQMHTDYFTNSISYMIAYAIYKEASQIDLYGCFMGNKTEYAYQKPCIEYWIGYARGKGIKVNVHEPTTLLRIHGSHLYGYNQPQEKF
jgi:hypothetical protein